MVRRCQVCHRLYSGWRCPCRKTQHSRHRRASRGSSSGGGRHWQTMHATAIVLGELPDDQDETVESNAEESETSV